ncbi:MAG: LuxR C-terminal-related transcriptional regulator [Actinobacteria bacterium]|nr:LuxR C-terminal-related transcriptional regulator [Actinomycetota bacterium]
MRDTLPSGTVTLLLGDLEGSVRAWERDPEAMAKAMARVDALITDHLEQHDGLRPEEQGEGDSFVLAFTRASDALACALDLQQAFEHELWPGGVDLRFRIALHTGEVELRDEHRYVGAAINRCARVRSLAHGGQTLLSRTTQSLVANRLPDGAGLRYLGSHELRGMTQPEDVYQLTHPALRDDFPAFDTHDVPTDNLPVQVTSFVGRSGELAEVTRLLEGTRVLTLTGAGGSGKTRLSLEAARGLGDRYPDGTWWADLASLADPDLVPAAVASAAGVQGQPGESLIETLQRSLRERHTLVIVDNCEHVIEVAAKLVDAVVHACPGVDVLATSREPLGIDGETAFRVPSLSLPADDASSIGAVGQTEAAQLFVDRARSVRPNFRLTEVNTPAVAQVCRRLDGIPLAIELAASRVRMLSPEQIADGLTDRFRLLTGGPRTAVPRQRTLEASVEWSYGLLSDQERLVLARLSAFAGTFGLDGAEQVCTDEGINSYQVLDLLSVLVDRSLVQVDESTGDARYRLLETIRVFARQRLADLDDPARVRDRHLAFCVGLAEQGRLGLVLDFDTWHARLAAEVDNLRAAMEWAVASGDPLDVVKIAEPIFGFWIIRGLYAEMQRRLRDATASPVLETVDRARGLTTAAILTLMGGDYPASYEFASEAVDLADQHDDLDTRTRSHLYRAWTGAFSGRRNDEQIWADLDLSHELATALGNPEMLARWGMYAGVIELNGRSISGGRATLEDALDVATASNLPALEIPIRTFLAVVGWWGADVDFGRHHASIAFELAQPLHFHAFASLARSVHGALHAMAGDETAARRHTDEANRIAQRAGLHAFQLHALRTLAYVEHRVADPATARTLADEALAAIGSRMGGLEEGIVGYLAGVAALRTGDTSAAQRHLEVAHEVTRDPSFRWAHGRALLGLAYLAGLDEDIETAWLRAHEALDVLATWGDPLGSAAALEAIAGMATTTGDPDKAARLLGAAERQYEERGIARFPLEADRHPAVVSATREALGPEEFDRLRSEGRALPWEDAVAYARRGRGERGRPAVGWDSLTPAERDVVRCVTEGLRNTEIAERLFVSVNTVKTHLSHVYTKLDLSSRAELAALAVRRDP